VVVVLARARLPSSRARTLWRWNSMSDLRQIGARRVTADVTVQIVARILNLALGVLVTLLIVHALGSRGFGVWSSLFAVTQIAASFGELGLNEVAASRAAGEPEREAGWLGALLSLRMLTAIPVTLASVVAVLLIAPSHNSAVAGVLLSVLLLVGVPTALNVVFQLRVRNDIPMGIMSLNSVVWAGAVILVSTLSGGVAAFAVAFFITSALTACLTVILALRLASVHLRRSYELWRPLLRVGIGLGIAGVLVTSYVRLDQILVLEFAGSRQAGLYGAAYRLLDQVQFIPISVMTTLFPLIAAAYAGSRGRAFELLQAAAEYLTMASLPILAFTIVAARPIMTLLFGSQFAAGAPALPILAGAFVSISFGYLAGNMVVILELQRRFVRYAAVGLLVNAVLNIVLIPRYGFLAAAWVTLITEVTVMSLTMRSVIQALDMRPRLGRLALTLVAASIMGLLTWMASLAGAPLGVLVAVAAPSYVVALLLLGVLVPGEIMAILRKQPVAPTGS
jgi:O-antigen/teichoic acid export membrane protein